MSTATRRRLAPLIWVTASAFVFTVLLVLVRTKWSPLATVDGGVADSLNRLVAHDSALVAVIKWVTWLGSGGVLATIIVAAAVIFAVRRRYRLALYVVVAGAGSLILDPVLKSLVGRLRPVVAHPVAYGTGNSFPSGHSLGSFVCYGALLLAFLPAIDARRQTFAKIAVGTLIAAIGVSRLLLGVHYLTDVLGAWALGTAWLGLTAYAFQIARHRSGKPVAKPLAEGLEPEAAPDITPTEAEPEETHGRPGGAAAAVAVAWVLIVGAVIGLGELITKVGNGNVLGDRTIPHWLAAHRTSAVDHWSDVASTAGATTAILLVTVTAGVVALAVLRRWRPVIFLATVMVGELVAFLVAAAVVRRPRPDVTQLDPHLPTFAYPSGHIAATCCVYVAIAILVIGHTRAAWRWLALVPAVVMPLLLIWSRMYRGEHHPTDVLGSLVFTGLWITATYLLIRPNADQHETAPADSARRPETATAR
jgi:undecaprenyl-diphosphatase